MLAELVAGEAGGLVLVQDTSTCNGRILIQAFAAAAVHRGESVHVLGFEVPEEEFRAGFPPDVAPGLLYQDGFTDPLHWSGRPGGFWAEEFSTLGVAERLQGGPPGPATIILDSLSWLLLRRPAPTVCRTLVEIPKGAARAGLRVSRIVALLHGDLHPPGLVETLRALSWAVVGVGPAPEGVGSRGDAPQLATTLQRKGSGTIVQKEEYFCVLPGFTLKALGEPPGSAPPDPAINPPSAADPTTSLTFNVRLSEAERRARDRVQLPFQFSAQKKSSLLEAGAGTGTGKIYYDPDAADDVDEEDPDGDLDV
ncbi:elongator complex protein 5 isoform X2 [Carettochelys insculpta]|uniref:elongator complex protein 5 isoform X2 n=1 Tax=Carettochelys insculpta TaxID=44489 RepID=UPI003EBED03F